MCSTQTASTQTEEADTCGHCFPTYPLVVVDVEMFIGDIIKEIGMCTSFHSNGFSLKAPYTFNQLSEKNQKQNIWLTKNRHGIEWNSGHIFYEDLKPLVQSLKVENAK